MQFATQREAEAYHMAANFDRNKWDNMLSSEERNGIYQYTSYVDPISANRGEKEFLFNRDTEFRVHAIKTGSGGRIRELVLEALPTRKPHK